MRMGIVHSTSRAEDEITELTQIDATIMDFTRTDDGESLWC